MNELLEREKAELSEYDFNKLLWTMYKRGDLTLDKFIELSYDI